MKAPERILVIRLSSLGDILHALPAFTSLRKSFPAARIDWLVEQRNRFLLSAVPGLDNIISIDTASPQSRPFDVASWRGLCRTVRDLRGRKYDLSIDFQGLTKTAFLGRLIGSPVRAGFGKLLVWEKPAHWLYNRRLDRVEGDRHVVEINQQLAASVGAVTGYSAVDLMSPPEAIHAAEERLTGLQLSDFVVINPGGGWPTKRWSPERYGLLAARITRELGQRVIVTTGPGEEELFREIAKNCSVQPHHFAVTFLDLIPLIRRSRLFIAGDTGPFHLACALGTPVVGIFGPTSPSRNGPWSPHDRCAVRVLPCSFCYGRACPTRNECMDISVDEVFALVTARLGAS